MQGFEDPDILQSIKDGIDTAVDEFLFATVDVANPNSIVMTFWNFLPIVGANPWPIETFLTLIASVGAIIAYFKWFR